MRPLSLILTTASLSAAAAPALAADLSVSIELPRINSAAYHRPYVAVWIEKPDQSAVQTLAVWYHPGSRNSQGDGTDWLRDLRAWWRKGGRAMAMPAAPKRARPAPRSRIFFMGNPHRVPTAGRRFPTHPWNRK